MSRDIASKKNTWGHTATLVVVVGLMFLFGFALVPIYNFVCEITGYNGRTTETTTQSTLEVAPIVDVERTLKVEFLANLDVSLPWEFYPVEASINMHPGEMKTVMFMARNKSSRERVGRATPFVAPREANKYLRKAECFCFTEQRFAAGEEKEMPVTFIIDPDLPKDIDTVTLSYTFFLDNGKE